MFLFVVMASCVSGVSVNVSPYAATQIPGCFSFYITFHGSPATITSIVTTLRQAVSLVVFLPYSLEFLEMKLYDPQRTLCIASIQ